MNNPTLAVYRVRPIMNSPTSALYIQPYQFIYVQNLHISRNWLLDDYHLSGEITDVGCRQRLPWSPQETRIDAIHKNQAN